MAEDRPSKRQRKEDEEEGDDSPSSGSEAEEAPGTDTRRALTVAWLDPEKEAEFDGRMVDAADGDDDADDDVDGADASAAPAALPPGVETAARPLFTHQLFDDERVEGYEGLRMTLAVSRRSLLSHASATWSSKEPGSKDVLNALEAATAVGTCTVSSSTKPGSVDASALAVFRAKLAAEPADLPWEELAAAAAAAAAAKAAAAGDEGEKAAAAAAAAAASPSSSTSPPQPLATHRAKKSGRSFSIYLAKLSTAGPRLRALHARLSSLLTFYIDAASPIDAADEGWDLLLAVEDFGEEESEGEGGKEGGGEKKRKKKKTPVVAGMATLFSMYGFPDRTRLRVCQVSVLPPCQKQGLGMALVEAAFKVADERGCLDVTFEDPTDEMQGMRERVEARRAAALPWLCSLADKAAEAAKKGAAAAASASSGKENGGGSGGKSDKGKGKAKAGAAATTTTAAASSSKSEQQPLLTTMLSPADAARARAELRVSRQQVPLAFEALLAARLGLDAPETREAVRSRLAASVAAAMSDAASKRVFDAPRPNPLAMAMAAAAAGGGSSSAGGSSNAGADDGGAGGGGVSGFVMCRVTPAEAEAAAAAGVAAPAVAEEEGAAEKNAAAIEQATSDRLELMAPVVAGLLKAAGS